MKLSSGTCKITGIQFGEATINLIRPDLVPIRAKLAFLSEDGTACGYFEKSTEWSDRTLAALQALADSIEEDALGHVFTGDSPTPVGEIAEEPPQF